MKILLITSIYLPHIGGIELYVKNLAANLIAKGHDVSVFVGFSLSFCPKLFFQLLVFSHFEQTEPIFYRSLLPFSPFSRQAFIFLCILALYARCTARKKCVISLTSCESQFFCTKKGIGS